MDSRTSTRCLSPMTGPLASAAMSRHISVLFMVSQACDEGKNIRQNDSSQVCAAILLLCCLIPCTLPHSPCLPLLLSPLLLPLPLPMPSRHDGVSCCKSRTTLCMGPHLPSLFSGPMRMPQPFLRTFAACCPLIQPRLHSNWGGWPHAMTQI